MRIAYITAGAAGMYCGNCLRDHALARALHDLGEEVTLVPIYTPLQTDLEPGPEMRRDPVFFNGIRAYLEQHVAYLREPRPVIDRLLGSRKIERQTPGVAQRGPGMGAQSVALITADVSVVDRFDAVEGQTRHIHTKTSVAATFLADLDPQQIEKR